MFSEFILSGKFSELDTFLGDGDSHMTRTGLLGVKFMV